MTALTVIAVAVLGLLCGSFANVLIFRVPRDLGWITGASKCTACRHEIAWYDNVPVVSWLFLRGRCRHCDGRISFRYPLVEIAVAAAFLVVYLEWGLSLVALAFAYLALVSVVLVVIDVDVRRLPDDIVLPSYLVGGVLLGLSALAGSDAWSAVRALIGMAALGGFYGLMWLIYPAGMGLGDVKAAGLLGLFAGFLGWAELGVAAIAGPLIGGVVVVVGLLSKRINRKSKVPYGPALIAGAWVGCLWGPSLWDTYMSALT